jgi:hypothetical protein
MDEVIHLYGILSIRLNNKAKKQKEYVLLYQLSYIPILVFCGNGGIRTHDTVVKSEVTLFYGTCYVFNFF